MGNKLLTQGGAFAHYFADCPCCGQQLNVTCRIQGNLAQVKAEHWGGSAKGPMLGMDEPITRVVVVDSPEGRAECFFFDAEGRVVDPDIDYLDSTEELKAKYGLDVIITD